MSNNFQSRRPQLKILAVRQRLRRSDDNRIARVDAKRIEVLHVADRDAVVAHVADDLCDARVFSPSDEAGAGLVVDFEPCRIAAACEGTLTQHLVLDLLPASQILIDEDLFGGRGAALQGSHLRGTYTISRNCLCTSTRRADSHVIDIDARWHHEDAIAATTSGSSSFFTLSHTARSLSSASFSANPLPRPPSVNAALTKTG